MFSSFIWIYILPMMLFSPFISISLNSWFSIWMSLELNLMTFIPVIIFFNKMFKELSIKYFIIQSISSSLLILSTNLLMIFNYNWYNFFINSFYNLIILSLLIKLGSAPFHYWFINLMKNLDWMSCLILAVWQKIIPMILISYMKSNYMIYFSIMFSMMIGALYGINHQSLRILMSYSSINHMSWMLLNIMISETLWMLYFLSYLIMNSIIMSIFLIMNIFYINQFFFININFKNSFFIMFNFFSMSGLPPLLGFLMKWFSILMISWYENFFFIIFMILLSILTFFFYTRMMISFMMVFKSENKLNMLNKINQNKFYLILFFFLLSFSNLWIFTFWIF